jgi:hypothetical protein
MPDMRRHRHLGMAGTTARLSDMRRRRLFSAACWYASPGATPMNDAPQSDIARDERSKSDGFSRWQDKPEIKMLISLLPPLETEQQRDCFTALLRSVFYAGHDHGAGSTAGMILQTMIERDDRRRK